MHIFRYFLVLTSVPPFTRFYRSIYSLLFRLAVWHLTRTRGVRSIFLIRAFAKKEEVYGLSDIDLLIIVTDEQAAKEVAHRYASLARLIPAFDRTHAIFTLPYCLRLLQIYDVFQYRFCAEAKSWELLYGEDIRRFLVSSDIERMQFGLLRESCLWWMHFMRAFLSEEDDRHYQKNYLLFKVVTSVLIVSLYLRDSERVIVRKGALKKAQALLGRRLADRLPAVWSLVSHKKILCENRATWEACFRLLRDLYDEWSAEIYHRMVSHSIEADGTEIELDLLAEDILITRASRRLIDSCGELLVANLGDDVQVQVVPWMLEPRLHAVLEPRMPPTGLTRDPWQSTGIDQLSVYISTQKPLSMAVVRDLSQRFGSPRGTQHIAISLAGERSCLRINDVDLGRDARPAVETPLAQPFVFFLLGRLGLGGARTDGEGFARCSKGFLARLKGGVARDEELIRVMLERGEVRGLFDGSRLAGCRLIYYAMQLRLASGAFERGRIDFPVTSRGIGRAVGRRYPERARWVTELAEEYERLMEGMGTSLGADAAREDWLVAEAEACLREMFASPRDREWHGFGEAGDS